MQKNKNFKTATILTKAKNLIEKTKEKGLIKPCKEAFKDIPVESEEHKGEKYSFIEKI